MENGILKVFGKSPIARRLTLSIILFSSLITLLITIAQLYVDYRHDVGQIHIEIGYISQNHLPALNHSIWVYDPKATQLILDSLVKFQDIEFLGVTVKGKEEWHSGTISSKRQIRETVPLEYLSAGKMTPIGTLEVVASLDTVYGRLVRKGVMILLGNGLKTFLVAFFALFVIQKLITKHLVKLADNAQVVTAGQEIIFTLDRAGEKGTSPDELDYVVSALNSMQERLSQDFINLSRAKEQIRENSLLLQSVMDGTTDCIFAKDKQGRYLLANRATCETIGKPHEEIIGRNDSELFPSSSAQEIDGNDSTVLREGKTVLAEERLETAYGHTVWLTNKSPWMDEQGQVVGLIGISRNITDIKNYEEEKRHLEERLNQAQKMEAIGTLAGGIAHDFNNILAAIIGYTELAQDSAPPNSRQAADLEKVLLSTLRAKDLVQQILAFSRQSKMEAILFQPANIAKEALKLLRATIPTTIDVQQDIDPNKCGLILADPTQFHQIMINLCTNAMHAMESTGGRLTVSLRNRQVGVDPLPADLPAGADAYVELSVQDTGHGISPEVQSRIFEPYFTTKGVGKGTGMGLAIVHGIVQSCGGLITVESAVGQGSTFKVYFPAARQGDIVEGKKTADLPVGSERILLVDDEEFLVSYGKEFLERLGYSVTGRTSSLEALQTFQNHPEQFDLVITDQTMPGLTGIDLSRRLLQVRPNIPIILCTGFSGLVDEHAAKAAGIKAFTMKPMLKKGIAPLIREVLATAQAKH
ncbi:MAG: PAS domain-containing protein [Proteobacteria bacterium]|nr:response regulator [Desulfobulbaceae bacterium]MBU4151433.1 PAS domain-containing protein [Pseudomonadota bacterium]